MYVSIHARVERATPPEFEYERNDIVSIHARVERATRADVDGVRFGVVSIHARVERATKEQRLKDSKPQFQSTHA